MTKNRAMLDKIAETLLIKETIEGKAFDKLMGEGPKPKTKTTKRNKTKNS